MPLDMGSNDADDGTSSASCNHQPADKRSYVALAIQEQGEEAQRGASQVQVKYVKGLLAAAVVLSVVASGTAFTKNIYGVRARSSGVDRAEGLVMTPGDASKLLSEATAGKPQSTIDQLFKGLLDGSITQGPLLVLQRYLNANPKAKKLILGEIVNAEAEHGKRANSEHSVYSQVPLKAGNNTCGPSSCSLHPKGPSAAWRPRKDGCSVMASCRNWGVWMLNGRLGNRLMSVGATLLQAAQLNLCYAWIPPDDLAHLQEIIDLEGSESLLDMTVEGNPLPYWWGNQNHCVTKAWTPYEVSATSQLMQDYFVSTGRLKCKSSNVSERPELGPHGVVIHMRSGDIMQPSVPSGFDPQPPCAFYVSVLEQGNNGSAFKHALIVTQADRLNPCIEAIQEWYPRVVKVQSSSLQEDACVIATAQNVAIAAYSTFDTGLVRLNVNLKNLHIPMGEDYGTHYYTHIGKPYSWPNHYLPWILVEGGMPYAQHVYSFPGYDTTWSNWQDRYTKMRNTYQWERITKRTIQALHPGRQSGTTPTAATKPTSESSATRKRTTEISTTTPISTTKTSTTTASRTTTTRVLVDMLRRLGS